MKPYPAPEVVEAAGGHQDDAMPPADQQAFGQLHHVSKGVLVACSTQGNWVVPPSKVLWVAPGVAHKIRCLGDASACSVLVRPESAGRLPARSNVLLASPLLLEVVTTVAQTPSRLMPARLTTFLAELLFEDVVAPSDLPFHLPAPRDHRLVAICSYIQQHRDEMKTLQQWASELNCDERTLHRLFVQEMGMSFVQWRQQAKLLTALEWLAEGRQILNIALDLGYQTQSAFTAMFRRNLGVAPSAFFRNSLDAETMDGAATS